MNIALRAAQVSSCVHVDTLPLVYKHCVKWMGFVESAGRISDRVSPAVVVNKGWSLLPVYTLSLVRFPPPPPSLPPSLPPITAS